MRFAIQNAVRGSRLGTPSALRADATSSEPTASAAPWSASTAWRDWLSGAARGVPAQGGRLPCTDCELSLFVPARHLVMLVKAMRFQLLMRVRLAQPPDPPGASWPLLPATPSLLYGAASICSVCAPASTASRYDPSSFAVSGGAASDSAARTEAAWWRTALAGLVILLLVTWQGAGGGKGVVVIGHSVHRR